MTADEVRRRLDEIRAVAGPGVTVVAFDPSEGPVPPPIRVVVPFDSAA